VNHVDTDPREPGQDDQPDSDGGLDLDDESTSLMDRYHLTLVELAPGEWHAYNVVTTAIGPTAQLAIQRAVAAIERSKSALKRRSQNPST
jgi:hypothetical protein